MSALNRQVGVYLIDGTTRLEESVYNAAGERAAMVGYQGGAATGFTKYLREGAAVVYEKSFTVSGGAHSSNAEKTYLYASGRMAVTKAKNLQSGAATYSYYGIDHLGTVRFSRTVDANGAVVQNGDASYAYEPFGVVIPGAAPVNDPSGNTHLYTGHERDAETGNDYMHFRFFSASMGRFQKPDSSFDSPIANPQGWNLYSYVKGNPVNFNDPTGHDANVFIEGGNVTVVVRPQVVADPKDKAAMKTAEAFKSGAEKFWNKQQVTGPKGEKITFDVKVSIVAPGSQDKNKDTYTLESHPGRAHLDQDPNAPDKGTLFTQDTTHNPSGMSGIAPHEVGHEMGLPDLYKPGEAVHQDATAGGDIMRNAAPGNNANSASGVLSPTDSNVIRIEKQPPSVPPNSSTAAPGPGTFVLPPNQQPPPSMTSQKTPIATSHGFM